MITATQMFPGALLIHDGRLIEANGSDIRLVERGGYNCYGIDLAAETVECLPSLNPGYFDSRYHWILTSATAPNFDLYVHKKSGKVVFTTYDHNADEVDVEMLHIKTIHELQRLCLAFGHRLEVDTKKLADLIKNQR